MDVDMNGSRGLFYCAPEFFLKTNDLHYMKIGIMTKGYGCINRENLVMTIGLLAKCTHNTNINYKIKIDDVIESIKSRGIRLIPTTRFSADIFSGITWDTYKLVQNNNNKSVPEKGEISKISMVQRV